MKTTDGKPIEQGSLVQIFGWYIGTMTLNRFDVTVVVTSVSDNECQGVAIRYQDNGVEPGVEVVFGLTSDGKPEIGFEKSMVLEKRTDIEVGFLDPYIGLGYESHNSAGIFLLLERHAGQAAEIISRCIADKDKAAAELKKQLQETERKASNLKRILELQRAATT